MKRLIYILCMLAPWVLSAQDRVWTLEECMRYAVEHNPQRAKQEAQNEIYRLNRQESIGRFLPTLSFGTNATLGIERTLVKDDSTYLYVDVNSFSNNYGIYTSMTLFNGFYNLNQAKIAKVNRMKGVNQLQETVDRIAFETMEIYFNVLYYQGTVQLAREQLEESTENLKRIKRMEELGLKSFPDVAEIQAQEAENRYALVKQENLCRLEMIKLKEKMNFPIDEDIRIAGHDMSVMEGQNETSAFDVYQQALLSLPKISALDKSLRVVELEHKVQRSRAYPQLNLQGGYTTGYSRLLDGKVYEPYEEQLRNRLGYYVTVSLNIPLFNGLSGSSAIKRSKQQVQIARYEREEILRQVYSEIEQAVADVNGLSAEYVHAVARTEAMQTAHQVNLRKYDEGLISAIDLNTSANRLLQSKVEELYTALKYQMKCRLVQYYKGESPLNFPESYTEKHGGGTEGTELLPLLEVK